MAKRVDGTSSSLHQPKEGGLKRKREIKAGNNYQELEELETELRGLKDGYEKLVKEKEELQSKRTALKQEIKTLKSRITASEQNIEKLKFRVVALERKSEKLKDEETELEKKIDGHKSGITYLERELVGLRSSMENMSMDIDSPKRSPGDPMEIDLSEGETDALFTSQLPKRRATSKLITQGTGNSQTEVLADKAQIWAELLKIDNKIPSARRNVELATNKHATAGKDMTKGAIKLKRKGEDELNEALNGKLAMAVDDTSTCPPTSSTLSSGFTSNTCQSIRLFATALVTQNHLLSTAGGAESSEATHGKRASTSASGIKGTTDILKLEKNLEAWVSLAIQLALEIARAQRESRAMNAEEEYSDNQPIETADDNN